jgi:hypothetical protein
MRSYLLWLLTFFVVGTANAQAPTITSSSEAVPGDILIYPQAQLSGVTLPATGANLTWDYSGLIDSGAIEVDSFLSPSSTQFASTFPSANLALNDGGGAYSYYKTTTSDWEILGFISAGSDTTYYTSTLDEFHFPFTYGSTYIDSSQYSIHLTGFDESFESVAAFQGVGYGTLKVPGKTYTSVLEVAKQAIQRQPFGSDTTSTIFFVTSGAHSFVMQITLGSSSTISKIIYVTTGVVVTTSYTFDGNGDWNNAANWSGSVVPTSPVPSGTTVTISPQAGGSCVVNVPVTFLSGSTLTVSTGAKFNIQGNLTIVK